MEASCIKTTLYVGGFPFSFQTHSPVVQPRLKLRPRLSIMILNRYTTYLSVVRTGIFTHSVMIGSSVGIVAWGAVLNSLRAGYVHTKGSWDASLSAGMFVLISRIVIYLDPCWLFNEMPR